MLLGQPVLITPRLFTRLPDRFRMQRRSEWADANKGGDPADSFLEGPSFDRAGHLYVVDIPFGRVFRIAPDGGWTQVAEYDGWPNCLKIHRDGRIFIADHRRGILLLDPASGKIMPVLQGRRGESFKGVNDLIFAANGDLYFTDQGQTGHQDPTGRVYRSSERGLDLLIGTVPSPNGIVLNLAETQVYVAVTRANAVWRLPLMPDGGASKCGTYIQLSGGAAGPDGMALDQEGGLLVCQLGIGVWRFDRRGIATHLIEAPADAYITNCAYGGPDNRVLYMTDSGSGAVLTAELPVAGRRMYSHA